MFLNVFTSRSQFHTGFFGIFIRPTPWQLIALRGAQPYGSGARLRVRCLDDVYDDV